MEPHSQGDSKTLVLSGLEDEWLMDIIKQVFEKRGEILTEREKQDVLKVIPGIDEKRRPLYTAFIADAAATGEKVRRWNKKHLHKYILGHIEKTWASSLDFKKNSVDRKHLNLLIFVTMCSGISTSDGQSIEDMVNSLAQSVGNNCLPGENNSEPEFDAEKYKLLSDNSSISRLCPLEPDILGEYFVLNEWAKSKRKKLIGMLWQKVWELLPVLAGWFLTRLFFDFADDIDYEQIKPKCQFNQDCSIVWLMTLFNIITIYVQSDNLEKAEEYFARLEELRHEGHQKDKEISLHVANAAFILMNYFARSGQFDKSEDYFIRIQGLRQEGHQKDKEISLQVAKAAVNLTNYFGKVNQFDKSEEYFVRLQELRQDGHQRDKEISLAVINAAFNLSSYFGDAGQIDKSVEYFARLEELRQDGYQKDIEISRVVANATFNLMLDLDKAGQHDKYVDYFARLEDLRQEGHQKDKEISLLVAKMALAIAIKFRKEKDSEMFTKYIKKHEEVCSNYQEDADFKTLVKFKNERLPPENTDM